MIAPPERSPARDAAIDAVLPLVPTLGWSRAALRGAGLPEMLFPGGGPDMVEAYIDLADRRMAEGADLRHAAPDRAGAHAACHTFHAGRGTA